MWESEREGFYSLDRQITCPFLHQQGSDSSQILILHGIPDQTLKKSSSVTFNKGGDSPISYTRPDNMRCDQYYDSMSDKKVCLDVSQLDYPDHDYIFENFDKMFRVNQVASIESIPMEDQSKGQKICRTLLKDFESAPINPTSYDNADAFGIEQASVGFISKEKTLHQFDSAPHKPFQNSKYEIETSCGMLLESKPADCRDIFKDMNSLDGSKTGLYSKLGKEKLPNLKIPKALVNSKAYNSLPVDEVVKAVEKVNKLQDTIKPIIKAKVYAVSQSTTNLDPVVQKYKGSQQVLHKIVMPKKGNNYIKSKTVGLEELKDKALGQSQIDDMRMRVNSLQGIENNLKGAALPNSELSFDLSNGTKAKFILKNIEQKPSSFYYQAGAGKPQNNAKHINSNNLTSRPYYLKENVSTLSNWVRDKPSEGGQDKKGNTNLIGHNMELHSYAQNSVGDQASKMNLEEISQLYKDLRRDIKDKDQAKAVPNVRTSINYLKSTNAISSNGGGNMEHKSLQVPQRCFIKG